MARAIFDNFQFQFKILFLIFFDFSLLRNTKHNMVVHGRRKNQTLFWAIFRKRPLLLEFRILANARCSPPRFLGFQGTQSGMGNPKMSPSCRELNSDDFPFFRNLSSSSRTRDSFFGSLSKRPSLNSLITLLKRCVSQKQLTLQAFFLANEGRWI